MDKKELEVLNKFINNEMQKDKLERDTRCGGWKIGDVYKYLELNVAIEKALKELDKQNKIIDKMADIINNCDIDYSDICKYRIVQRCEKAPEGCKECVKKYFEKKVEEEQMEKDNKKINIEIENQYLKEQKKELLTAEEKEFLKQCIKFSGVINTKYIVLYKNNNIVFLNGGHQKINVFRLFDDETFYFKKLIFDKEYTLEELGLEGD